MFKVGNFLIDMCKNVQKEQLLLYFDDHQCIVCMNRMRYLYIVYMLFYQCMYSYDVMMYVCIHVVSML